jgi:hypothetical protein
VWHGRHVSATVKVQDFWHFAIRKDVEEKDWDSERQNFFSKGQPCLRKSQLTKKIWLGGSQQ